MLKSRPLLMRERILDAFGHDNVHDNSIRCGCSQVEGCPMQLAKICFDYRGSLRYARKYLANILV